VVHTGASVDPMAVAFLPSVEMVPSENRWNVRFGSVKNDIDVTLEIWNERKEKLRSDCIVALSSHQVLRIVKNFKAIRKEFFRFLVNTKDRN
jgi:hypothetical protein